MKHPRFHQPQKLLGVLAAALLIFLTGHMDGRHYPRGGQNPLHAGCRNRNAGTHAHPHGACGAHRPTGHCGLPR